MKEIIIMIAFLIPSGLLGIYLFGKFIGWGLDKMSGPSGRSGKEWLEVQKMLNEVNKNK